MKYFRDGNDRQFALYGTDRRIGETRHVLKCSRLTNLVDIRDSVTS